jgi:hypothetical protein
MQLRFVTSESAFDYFRTTRAYVEEHGKPVAFYSDKHGIFRVNSKEAAGGEGVTQFGRALLALNIDIICANSPQAKGRIERAFGTLQDRMVKELRLAGISSIAAANAWLPGFITAYNTRFGRDPANAKDLRRPLAQADAPWPGWVFQGWGDLPDVSVTGEAEYGPITYASERGIFRGLAEN